MLTEPPDILLVGDPLEKITMSFGGMVSSASRLGFATLWEFDRRIREVKSNAWFRMIQPAFSSNPKSAGTHTKFDVWDYEVVGWDDWYAESRLARLCGLADWVRHPGQGFSWHHHAASRATPSFMLDNLVPAQLDDFNRHALGLRGQHDSGDDPQCFTNGRLTHRLSPPFNYAAWKARYTMLTKEDKDWIKDAIASALRANNPIATDVLMSESIDTEEDGKKVTVRQGLRRTSRGHDVTPNK